MTRFLAQRRWFDRAHHRALWIFGCAASFGMLLLPSLALADSTAATSAGSGAVNTGTGTINWTTPGNILTSNDAYAQAAGQGTAFWLRGSTFGFAIPASATIDGILLEIEQKKGGMANGGSTEAGIKIVKADATIGTTNKSTGAQLSTTDTYVSYGSSSDLWGETWTDTNINDVDFGAVFTASLNTASTVVTVDHMRITITYTPAAVPEFSDVGLILLLCACLYVANREGWLRFSTQTS